MDINRLRKKAERHMKADSLRHKISKQIKDYRERQVIQYESKESFKPIMDTQKGVKETFDEEQDKLIEKLQGNQENINNSLDALSDIVRIHLASHAK